MDPAAVARINGEIQGNILESYGVDYGYVRHVIATVGDAAKARAALKVMADPALSEPTITSDASTYEGPCLNVAMTYLGLEALGVPQSSLRTFPIEFREGMVARAAHLGDVGASSPAYWEEALARPASVHLIFTIHATDDAGRRKVADGVVAAGRDGAYRVVGHLDGEALKVRTDPGDPATEKRVEHFGFRDGLSQPRFEGVGRRPRAAREPVEPLGIVLLGHPNKPPNIASRVPQPLDLGYQGSFNAFRVLGQDVAGFRAFVTESARSCGISEELLMAKMCGRWRNGVPLSAAGTPEEAEAVLASGAELNDFDFSDDQDGGACPVGSHIRRTYPRRAHIVQRPANRSRRLVRRGVPFGTWLETGESATSTRQRGLLGSFLCASLSTQFEPMQYDWINLGLLDPNITGTNDPMVGANEPKTSSFTFSTAEGGQQTISGLPRFVETMGGAYAFLPSLKAIAWIVSQSGP